MLLSLGIANFKGKLSSLTAETILFPQQVESETSSSGQADAATSHPDHLPGESDGKTRQLEAKLAAMHRLLQSKDSAIAKLQQELVTSDESKKKVEDELQGCQDSEGQFKVALEKSQLELNDKATEIEGLKQVQAEAKAAHERTVKSLSNEKSILQAAVEVRDTKIEGLTAQVAELKHQTTIQSEQLASIESLKSNLFQTKDKFTSAEKVISKMKSTEQELQEDLKSAKSIVLDLNDKFRIAKETASTRESESRKLKMERISLKHKAEGLSKEMLRMSKNNTEALEIEKLKAIIEALQQENASLQEQITASKMETRVALEKLEATSLAHQQSVSYQLSNNEGGASEQRIDELESVISSMTEYLNAKEMQIDTLKQVNGALAQELNELTTKS